MKKIILSTAIAFFTLLNVSAQDDTSTSSNTTFGVKAGFNSFIARASADGASASANASGFYFGVFADIEVADKFNIQPELQYISISEGGGSGNVLAIPIMGKYKVADKFSLLAGPQFDLILDDSEGLKKLGLGLGLGMAYDISDDFFLDMRYSFGLSNRLDDNDEEFGDIDVNVKFNYFQVGLGYKF
ncbi:hypothetical protein FBALC1_11132 [Flavobacteriales bacterium ALC-1]|nr:hypothetical protein FBALC1_11132 [Flavobacteriales bacterium ALC-1]